MVDVVLTGKVAWWVRPYIAACQAFVWLFAPILSDRFIDRMASVVRFGLDVQARDA